MTEYPKIQSIYKRNPETNFKTFLEGEFSLPEFEYLKNNTWIWTEKVDGTNIRVYWNNNESNKIQFAGRTDRAQIPPHLLKELEHTFQPSQFIELFTSDFVGEVILFGEGFGYKIQKGGKYLGDKVGFVLFDILVNGRWNTREQVEGTADFFCIPIVPIVGKGTLLDAVEIIKSKITKSEWGDFLCEGFVLRPEIELADRNGNRIITKIKHKDFV